MTRLTPEGTELVQEIAGRYGVSTDAVETLLIAVARGNGMQAQFNHMELGGMGQWSQGGMTMVGDMFNNGLKATVNSLCSELSQVVNAGNIFAPLAKSGSGHSLFVSGSAAAWPAELGSPSSTGAQNSMRYGVFPDKRRLAVEIAGHMEVYDTGDHQISGVSQQQSGDQSLTFTSQYGVVRIADLPKILGDAPMQASPEPSAPVKQVDLSASVAAAVEPVTCVEAAADQTTPDTSADAIISLIKKLADLKEDGILTEAEFEAKKAELLSRL